jgi:hypothetical protein
VPGVRDDVDAMLRQLGVTSIAVNAEDLLSVDLSKFSTLVIGPRAYEVHPEIAAQNARLLDFVRNGGTMVVMNGQYPTSESGVLPYPAVLSRPAPEHVTTADAPVRVLAPRSRLFNWPNVIGPNDWNDWVRERALFVPSAVGPQYTHLLEMHDPGEKENENSLLTVSLGKGTFIYSTLTFFEQLPGGVSGSGSAARRRSAERGLSGPGTPVAAGLCAGLQQPRSYAKSRKRLRIALSAKQGPERRKDFVLNRRADASGVERLWKERSVHRSD